MPPRLRVGIVGLRRGRAFEEVVRQHPALELAAGCDLDPVRLHAWQESFPRAAAFTEFSTLLDSGIDLVLLATPLPCHVPQAVEALGRGVHVFSEVPAAASLEECETLLRAVQRSSAKYMLGENACYMKPHMIVSNMARAGLFGDLYYAEGEYVHYCRGMASPDDWRADLFRRRGGTYLTHALGPILEWMQDRVVMVTCLGTGSWTEPRFGGDDCSVTLCRTARGALLSLRNDLLSPRPFSGYASVQGTKGAYETNWSGTLSHRVYLLDPAHPDAVPEWQPLKAFEDEFLPDLWRGQAPGAESAAHGGADGLVLLDFVAALLEDRPPPIGIYRALDMTAPGLASELSAQQEGQPVVVPDYHSM